VLVHPSVGLDKRNRLLSQRGRPRSVLRLRGVHVAPLFSTTRRIALLSLKSGRAWTWSSREKVVEVGPAKGNVENLFERPMTMNLVSSRWESFAEGQQCVV
jgi:hypothetical protein